MPSVCTPKGWYVGDLQLGAPFHALVSFLPFQTLPPRNPLEVNPSLGLLKPMPIGYIRHHSHVCRTHPPLPSQGSSRSCFALLKLSQDLLIRPDLIYYIVGSITSRGFKLFKFLGPPLDPSFPLSVCFFPQ